MHLHCFCSSLHLKHVNLHFPCHPIFSTSLDLNLVMVLPSFRHLLYFLALVPGACPGFESPSYILIKGFICWKTRAQTIKPEYGLLVQCTSCYQYLESNLRKCLSLGYQFSSLGLVCGTF